MERIYKTYNIQILVKSEDKKVKDILVAKPQKKNY
jgi:hypothetical protein